MLHPWITIIRWGLAFGLAWLASSTLGFSLGPGPDGAGLSLVAGSAGFPLALLHVVAVLALLVLAARIGNGPGGVFEGPFLVALGLGLVALRSGSANSWAQAVEPGTTGFLAGWMLESSVWGIGLVAAFLLGTTAAKPWTKSPEPPNNDHLVRMDRFSSKSLIGGLICCLGTIALAWFLVRDGSSGQVYFAAALSAFLSAAAARLIVPSSNPLPLLVGAMLGVTVVYGYAAATVGTIESFWAAWNVGTLPGVSKGLPIQATAGALLGVMAGSLFVAQTQEIPAQTVTRKP